MSVVYLNQNSNSHRNDKAVTFDDGYRPQPRPNSTPGNPSNLNPWNKGYSTDNLYWGFKQEDPLRVRAVLSENQSKFIQDRISNVEKHFGDLCTNFGGYTRKLGRVRDKGDELGRSMVAYAQDESLNHTTKAALTDFVESFSAVQDFREIQVRSLETKVLTPLGAYGHQCKVAKDSVKKAFAAREKELKEKKKRDVVRDKRNSDRHSIAEHDLHRAAVDASHTSLKLEEEMDSFEKKKLSDIKSILMEFVNVELLYHAKALEMYTMCYQSLSTIDEQEDLEEFRNSLRPPAARARIQQMQAGSRTSLNSTGQSHTQSHETPPRAKQQKRADDTMNTTNASQYTEDDDDDDDEEEESEEEDSEEEESEEDDTEDYTETEPSKPAPKRPQSATTVVTSQKKTYSMFQAQSSPQAAQRRK